MPRSHSSNKRRRRAKIRARFPIGRVAPPRRATRVYLWTGNLPLPSGQLLWERNSMSYIDYPAAQFGPASYNLRTGALQTVREMSKQPERSSNRKRDNSFELCHHAGRFARRPARGLHHQTEAKWTMGKPHPFIIKHTHPIFKNLLARRAPSAVLLAGCAPTPDRHLAAEKTGRKEGQTKKTRRHSGKTRPSRGKGFVFFIYGLPLCMKLRGVYEFCVETRIRANTTSGPSTQSFNEHRRVHLPRKTR